MTGFVAGLLLALAGLARAGDDGPPTFRVDWIVRIAPDDPAHAHVRWLFAGIDEIERFRVTFRDARARDVHASGRLERHGATVTWTPGAPYAHFEYTVAIDRHRPASGPRFDSRAEPGWVATRARHLFPEIDVTFRPGVEHARSQARLLFELPPGWRSVAAGRPLGEHVFAVEEPTKRLDRPRGWFLLGDVTVTQRRLAGSDVVVAAAPGSQLDVPRLFRFWDATLPLLVPLFGPPPPRLLLVSAPDPMWRGGISGEDSFYVNGRIPIRSPDATSTYLHELVHVWQPFRPGPDGRWISEGLAEYTSLLVQYRASLLDDARFRDGLQRFAEEAVWGEDLTRTTAPRVLNDAAPLVLAALDLEIRRGSGGRHGLDDVVRALAASPAPLTTAALLRESNRASGLDLGEFFRRHVFHGGAPPVPLGLVASLNLPGTVGYTLPFDRVATR